MAKGGGLSIDSDLIRFFLHNNNNSTPTVINSFPQEDRHHHHPPKWKLQAMDTTATIQFPVNLNCTHEQDSAAPSDHKRTVVDEMDFFADSKRADSKPVTSTDPNQKDFSTPTRLDFNVNTGLHLLTANTSSDQSMVDDGISVNSDDKRAKNELVALQAKLEQMNTENQRLRDMLSQVSSNYNTLQMHLMALMQQQGQKVDVDNDNDEDDQTRGDKKVEDKKQCGKVPRQFMDLGLADADDSTVFSPEGRSGDVNDAEAASKDSSENEKKEYGRGDSPDNAWGPNKVPILNPSKNGDQTTEATTRKARVTVRARSEATMITDGCQWRKYGQKMAKGNPCPRAYYRCTMAAACPVRKQVQRCAEDRTILITTYEGNHNHPLPPAAMAMASTTSSAAQMLLSGSMQSADGLINSNFLARTLLPCSSMATISASAPFPTVTLDLTQTPNPLQFQRPPTQFHVPFPNPSQNFAATPLSLLPQVFGQALYNQSKFSPLQLSGQEAEAAQLGQQTRPLPPSQQSSLADTVTAITADPNFTAALAAAITSIISGNSSNNNTSTNTANGNNGSANNNGFDNNKAINSSNFTGN